jgi:murein DD-endopeptidase MepM/ murein hydrolase activator NlpD
MYKYWLKACSIILLLILFPSRMVNAQDTSTSGPVYIVQEGDSLWDIAYRFHVSQEDLAAANGILNTNQITIGQALVIPGLEDVQGVLITESVLYGETLRSLSTRYKLPIDLLERLNHLTSPNEIFAGYSLVIIQNNDATTPGKRITLSESQSLLETAVLNGTDPWTILLANHIDNTASAIPGEVFRLPTGDDPGPGELPPSISSVDVSGLIQGQTAEIQVEGSTGLSLSGSLIDHTLNFFQTTDKHYVALQGVHSKVDPGLYSIDLSGTETNGAQFSFSQMALLTSGDYYYEIINNVDPVTLDPTITGPEDLEWEQLFSPVSTEKYWDNVFSLPVDPAFAGCYTSWYGARRSYNGSAYEYVHTGQDICGQIGNPIYAAASGVVVFAGPLTVRGNATMIDHGWGVYTAYMHQSEILVKVGDRVEQGQLIGKVGNTGRVEGPHLHFEVIVGGIQVDPLQWLSQEFP